MENDFGKKREQLNSIIAALERSIEKYNKTIEFLEQNDKNGERTDQINTLKALRSKVISQHEALKTLP
jgi:hypothetical protein